MKNTTKKNKINFNKFFPQINGFITVEGKQTTAEEWDLSVVLQNGTGHHINIWASDWLGTGHEVLYLKALKEAVDKSIQFVEKCQAEKKAAKKVVIDKDKTIKGMKK